MALSDLCLDHHETKTATPSTSHRTQCFTSPSWSLGASIYHLNTILGVFSCQRLLTSGPAGVTFEMPSYTAGFTVLDHLMPPAYTTMHFCFRTSKSDDAIQTLRNGLDKTVRQLPFLSGQVYQSPQSHHQHTIDWSDDDPHVELEEVTPPGLPSYDELAQHSMLLHLLSQDLRPLEVRTFKDRSSHTALAMSCTRLNGGLIITICNHHRLMDGGGRQMLYQILARNVRGEDASIALDPTEPISRVQRFAEMVGAVDEETTVRTDSMKAFSGNTTSGAKPNPATAKAPALGSKFLCFSTSKLKQLAQELQGDDRTSYSTNTTCSALLWFVVTRERALRMQETQSDLDLSEESTVMVLATNMRKHFTAEGLLDKDTWLGNLLTGTTPPPSISLDVFTEQQSVPSPQSAHTVPSCLPRIAQAISSSIASTSAKSFRKAMAPIIAKSGSPDFDFTSLLREGARAGISGLTFYVTNWAGFDFYQDFGPGLGRPEFLRAGVGGINGLCVVLPRKYGDGWTEVERDTLEVMLYLREDDMKQVEKSELLSRFLKSAAVGS